MTQTGNHFLPGVGVSSLPPPGRPPCFPQPRLGPISPWAQSPRGLSGSPHLQHPRPPHMHPHPHTSTTNTRTCTWSHAYTHLHICTHAHGYTPETCTYTCTHAHTVAHIHAHAHMQITHAHTHLHTYTHTYTRTQTQPRVCTHIHTPSLTHTAGPQGPIPPSGVHRAPGPSARELDLDAASGAVKSAAWYRVALLERHAHRSQLWHPGPDVLCVTITWP